MIIIADLIDAIRRGTIRITHHADQEAEEDGLKMQDVFESVFQGEIIESYPEARPYPSCLVFGMNSGSEPIHRFGASTRKISGQF